MLHLPDWRYTIIAVVLNIYIYTHIYRLRTFYFSGSKPASSIIDLMKHWRHGMHNHKVNPITIFCWLLAADYYWFLLTTIGYFRLLMTTAYYWLLSTIIDYWLLTVTEYYRMFSILLRTTNYYWVLTSMSYNWVVLANFDYYWQQITKSWLLTTANCLQAFA